MNSEKEKQLFELMKNNSKIAFEKLFHTYYGHLCLYAARILRNDDSAEEIVQVFFVNLWEKRDQLSIETSVNNYFFRSVKNLCLNNIQHNKTRLRYAQSILSDPSYNLTEENNFVAIELAEKIEESIRSLPEKRQNIFRLSRQEGLKYREIAEKLNISIKTVETQMGLALKTLRDELKNYATFFIL